MYVNISILELCRCKIFFWKT